MTFEHLLHHFYADCLIVLAGLTVALAGAMCWTIVLYVTRELP